ncbi:MAG: site-specific integrase [Muribaculaceae bacterium]|nr:site-specific integrase [Muribaculaceae bacterium]
MFTYKFIIRANKNNSLRLRLTSNRKNVEIAVGLQISQEVLDDALSIKPRPENLKWRSVLMMYQAKLDEIKCTLLKSGNEDEDINLLKKMVLSECFNRDEEDAVEKPAVGAFVTHFQKFIDGKENIGTKGIYEHTLNRIKLFDPLVGGKSFEEIDLKWLTDFEAFCAQTASKNARNIHLRNIRAVFNNAIDYEITAAYPFRRFKIRPEVTRKRALSVEELRDLFSRPVEPYAETYRDMFKLIFMLVGINTVDLHGLKCVRKGRVEYKRAKTGRLYSIKVEPEAMEIINKYQGVNGLLCIADRWSDHRNFRHQLNKALQRIGEVERKGRGGKKMITPAFPGLSSYWARHTWATIARKIGVSKDDIALALGHADESHATTNIYIDDDLELIDKANRRVLDWVLYGKR